MNESINESPNAAFRRIGFVGMGIMGRYMAKNLLNARYQVFVYNRTPEKTKPLTDSGAVACATPEEVGERSQLAITCVSDAPDVEEVIMGPQGVAKGLGPTGIIVDCSTSSPELAKRMEEDLRTRGIGVLDAPVSGGPEGARLATLAIMVGGRRDVFERALPVLQTLGKSVTYVGPAGAGQLTKAVNQIIVACNLEAVAEGITLARKYGLDPLKVIEAISEGAARSWVLDMRSPKMLLEDFSPAFALALHNKDLRLALEAAHSCGAKLDFAERIRELFQQAVDSGYGHLDNSGIFMHMKEKNEL